MSPKAGAGLEKEKSGSAESPQALCSPNYLLKNLQSVEPTRTSNILKSRHILGAFEILTLAKYASNVETWLAVRFESPFMVNLVQKILLAQNCTQKYGDA